MFSKWKGKTNWVEKLDSDESKTGSDWEKVWEKISKDKKLTARKKRNRMQMEDKTV
jgi:hypothetical protein